MKALSIIAQLLHAVVVGGALAWCFALNKIDWLVISTIIFLFCFNRLRALYLGILYGFDEFKSAR